MLSEKVKNNEWGKGVVTEFAQYIVSNAPNIKGFSDKNLWRMKQFYETYADHPELSALLREIPWTHNMSIFSRCKSTEERRFYIKRCICEKYSTRNLERQINASLYERTQLGDEKLSSLMRELEPSAKQVFKNSYVLEFLGLPEEHTESDLQKELVKQLLHIKSFIGTSENSVMTQIWIALITILILKALKASSKFEWYLSNLVSFIRLNLFVKINLQTWLDKPFEDHIEPPPNYYQGVLF